MRLRIDLKVALVFFLPLVFFTACTKDYTPKKRAYYKIEFPEKAYVAYNPEKCPFEFEIPQYAKPLADSIYFSRTPDHPCWVNFNFKGLGGDLHLSYRPIYSKADLEKLLDDAHKLTFKHTIKADYIDERLIRGQGNATGILYDVGGNAASNVQFFLTDSSNHFLRGAMYFRSTPNIDSLAPVLAFVREDLMHMIHTFRWKPVATP